MRPTVYVHFKNRHALDDGAHNLARSFAVRQTLEYESDSGLIVLRRPSYLLQSRIVWLGASNSTKNGAR